MTESTISKKLSGVPAWPVLSPTEKENAMSHENLSRRTILAIASALPGAAALGLAPSSSSALTDERITQLEASIGAAWEELGKACEVLGGAERKVFDWEKLNPMPQLGEWPHGDLAAERSAVAKYEAGLTDRGKRKRVVEEECGYTAAKAYERAAGDKLSALIDEMEETPARNLRDFVIKARVAERMDSDSLAWSIVAELQANEAVKS
jgi:hypothetical protein